MPLSTEEYKSQNALVWREGICEGLESNSGGITIASRKPEFSVVCLLLTSLSCFSDMDMCMDRCCAQRGCNVAYMVDKNCFSVACFSPSLCKISDVSSTNGDVEISTIMESTAERPAEKREYKNGIVLFHRETIAKCPCGHIRPHASRCLSCFVSLFLTAFLVESITSIAKHTYDCRCFSIRTILSYGFPHSSRLNTNLLQHKLSRR